MAARRDEGRKKLHMRAGARRIARTRAEKARGLEGPLAYERAAAAWPMPWALELGAMAPLDDYLRALETRNS